MAYKINYNTGNKDQTQKVQQPKEQQSGLQSIISQITRPISRAYETVSGVTGTIGELGLGLANKGIEKVTGKKDVLPKQISLPNFKPSKDFSELEFEWEPIPTIESQRKQSGEYLEKYLGKGANTATKPAEKLIDAVASVIPLAILTGGTGAIAGAAEGAAAGEVARQGAEAIGFGEVGQTIADIGGSLGRNLLRGGATPGKIRKVGEHKMKSDYSQAEKIAPRVKIFNDVKPIVNDVEKEISFLISGNSGLEKNVAKNVISELNETYNLLNKPKVNLKDAWDKKKHLNSLISDSENKKVSDIYRRIVGSINDQALNGDSAVKSGFNVPFQQAENLHKAINVPNKLRRILEDNLKLEKLISNPIASLSLLGGAAFLGATPKKLAIGIPAAYGARYLTRAYDFAKNPVARKLWGEIAEEALSNNIPALTNSLTKYNQAAEEYMGDNPIPKSYKINWKK